MSAIATRSWMLVERIGSSRWWRILWGPWWRWLAVPFGVVYLVLLVAQFGSIISNIYLDADTASAPVIAELAGNAGPHATVVLGTFGWYSTLIFDLATKWLPFHRQIWEGAPYLMALAAAGITGWAVWRIAGRWAGAISAVLILCAAPNTLHLLLSTTEHGPDWFCLAVLGGFLVLVERPGARLCSPIVLVLTPLIGIAVGINAASDGLVEIAGLVPFGLAVLTSAFIRRGRGRFTSLAAGSLLLVVVGIAWAATRIAMSQAQVIPEPGVNNTLLAAGDHIASNFKLWWQSVAVLGNGDFFGRKLSFTSGLAVLCAALSIGTVALLPRLGWRELSTSARTAASSVEPERLAFIVFWSASAALLTGAFLVSAIPVDIFASRYLTGLIYAAAAVIPPIAARRSAAVGAVTAGAVVFSLAAVISMADGRTVHTANVALTQGEINAVVRVAESNNLSVGYGGYWEAAPITWASQTHVRVYPVSTCGGTLCPFFLHYISSWYTPRRGARTFLLTSTVLPFVAAPPPNLGQASAVYHAGRFRMYVYPYDLASRMPGNSGG